MTTGATTVGVGPTVSAQHAAHGTHAPASTLRAA
jgi:hypothetical protein